METVMMKLHEAAASIGVYPQGGDAEFLAVGTDSRSVTAGMLFVALKGDRFDGHEFVRDVLAAGAVGAMVEQRWAKANPGLPLIPVVDTRAALGQLAAHWRARFRLPLLGITGSNGKTTVKEMCASILGAHFGDSGSVLATVGNLNNDIGLPLTHRGDDLQGTLCHFDFEDRAPVSEDEYAFLNKAALLLPRFLPSS